MTMAARAKQRKSTASLIAQRAEYIRDPDIRPSLFRLVAETIRARFSPEDAAVVAAWFDRIAAGEHVADVLTPGRGRGRTKGATNRTLVLRKKKGSTQDESVEVSRPDEVDLAWHMRRLIASGQNQSEVIKTVAADYGMKRASIANLFHRVKKTLGPDPG